jgi:hypothetical protein
MKSRVVSSAFGIGLRASIADDWKRWNAAQSPFGWWGVWKAKSLDD